MSIQSLGPSDVKEQAESNRQSGTQLVETTDIKGSPFKYIHNNETKKGFISLGPYIIKDGFNNIEEAEKELPNVNNWEMLINIIAAITQSIINTLNKK